MKMHRPRDIEAKAWAVRTPDPGVFIQFGWLRFTATPAEARTLACALVAAADNADQGRVDGQ
ncbi:Uncharacterised protein [Mycobacteroides abscessus subsp. massiliense]|uniref:hypothetical protein n=1 Tax=Mycobacteroides abscessus TaxID=36809 RepID=UPI0009C4AF45|nr:hypothetical protein [Mycobacteroides abscessus]SLH68853.1 Uncharacterised protein [Mycobacteroides abscessus subsp. massiliense]SLI87978.1 Uncharacterised protein [Mycobacteroides abscessus subsp. massiliense]